VILSVQDLKVYFYSDERVARAVDGVTYEVEKGETVCLVGESGCGKTVSALTIMRILPMPPGRIMGGRILFNVRNLLDLDDRHGPRVQSPPCDCR
jgi:ABC-type dipeptide/oligopeptide/nickel transport system ATPase component